MQQDSLAKLRRSIALSYVFMFFALFTLISAIFAYWLARKVVMVDQTEVWLQAQALWVMRNVMIYSILAVFAALWFIPLFFYAWNDATWVTATTIAGVVFSAIAFLYLLNAWIKGLSKFMKNKAVF
ncbi:hypothetical protein ABFP25_10515 [Acinetobacter indicus]|uniref:Uncharacterized protein n=2 Tax=Acinetobacter indicus TaxID=756892 RepID=V2UDR6_9GAMM|nr:MULTISPECIES: hypothetical protein [Acinetobacter]AVH15454.1 hypothetical protein CTZ23_14985 [Acinetobacter indicus]ENW87888.1 hypothetical protein F905_02437 [Acinetobacter sp. CIP 53.82]EPF73116.1 hypothetical protein F956_01225 [Acinetobacter indicus ANC 4215]ESK47011.1 hypothetical protein P253_02730 [Acinetobacter indicus CIP 110367]KJV44749.1 membrane protein [Acinetobacter indicus]